MALHQKYINKFSSIAGKSNVLYNKEDLVSYSFDSTFSEGMPDLVVLPETTEQVSGVLCYANSKEIPVVARGMASGLAGGSIPVKGGICLSLNRMNKIREIDLENMTAVVEAGVITSDFQAEVEKQDCFYPPDPSSVKQSTIGGNVACNAGGPRCLKYGVTGDYVLGLTTVLASGEILDTKRKIIKNVTGYNLNQLLIGSEGTLGVVTEIMLRIIGKPRFAKTAIAYFDSLEDASRSVNAILHAGVVPATLELMDKTSITCIEEAMGQGLPLDKEAMLIVECDGNYEDAVIADVQLAADACTQGGASGVLVAESDKDRAEIWKARRSVSPSLARKAPNKLGEDISVPRSAIPEAIERIQIVSKECGLPIAVFGHAGDGNLHPNILFDKRIQEQWEMAEKAAAEIFSIALDLGGTLSGEHGIGLLKKPWMQQDLGRISIAIQNDIKKSFDPKGILNPGKVLRN